MSPNGTGASADYVYNLCLHTALFAFTPVPLLSTPFALLFGITIDHPYDRHLKNGHIQ